MPLRNIIVKTMNGYRLLYKLNAIINTDIDDKLDITYILLHILTEQIELFFDKISQDFYE